MIDFLTEGKAKLQVEERNPLNKGLERRKKDSGGLRKKVYDRALNPKPVKNKVLPSEGTTAGADKGVRGWLINETYRNHEESREISDPIPVEKEPRQRVEVQGAGS